MFHRLNKFSCTAILLLFTLSAFSQNQIDSLNREYEKAGHDTLKGSILQELSSIFIFSNPDTARQITEKYTAMAEQMVKSKNEAISKKGKLLIAGSYITLGSCNYVQSNYEEALKYYETAEKKYNEIGDVLGAAQAINNQGLIYQQQGDYEKALSYYSRNYDRRKELGDSKAIAASINNMGLIHEELGQYKKALEYMLESLRIKERMKDTKGVSSTLNNIGLLYSSQKENKKALEYYQKAIASSEDNLDDKGIATGYHNMANVFYDERNFDMAIEYLNKALEIRKRIGDKRGTASSLNNLGAIYVDFADSVNKINPKDPQIKEWAQKALSLVTEAYEIRKSINDKNGQCSSLNNIGGAQNLLGNTGSAIYSCESSRQLAISIGSKEREMHACNCLAEAYKNSGNGIQAYHNLERYYELKDSLESEENVRELTAKTLEYEYEKKSIADSLKRQEEERIKEVEHKAEIEKQQWYTNIGIIGFLIMALFFIVSYRSFLQKKKSNKALQEKNTLIEQQKQEVQLQKDIIEVKNKEIVDSINYARRIQTAILPEKRLLEEKFSENFILFRPRDIVSGDFYWIEKIEERIYVSVVDCTGHGVPGAFVSLLAYNMLNRAVKEKGKRSPGEILNEIHDQINETLGNSSGSVRDGMDISLCCFYAENSATRVEFAGAQNSLWIMSNRLDYPEAQQLINEKEKILFEVKADRRSIGGEENQGQFTNHSFLLNQGDSLYLFSDGYADQFGGPRGKKFKQSQFAELLYQINERSMPEQGKTLEDSIDKWKGEIEQLDDVCVIGLRL